MARGEAEIKMDQKMLAELAIGSRVQYGKHIGTVSKFTKYTGRYGERGHRRYNGYVSVTIKLDNSNRHISCSPRNLILVSTEHLREFKSYEEMEAIHQKEINEFPFVWVFAFCERDFIKEMSEKIKERKPKCTGITTMDGIAKHVVSIGAGGFVFKEDVPAMNEMFKKHKEERMHFEESEDNLIQMILCEMQNHEYVYTQEPYDTLRALGKTEASLKDDKLFSVAWKKAEQELQNLLF